MSKIESPKFKVEETISEELSVIDGELLENSSDEEVITQVKTKNRKQISIAASADQNPKTDEQKSFLQYIILPLIFLTAALLGGLRFGAEDNQFLFLKPPLVCLIFASILLVLFFRSNLIRLSGWFSEDFSPTKNLANTCVLLTLFFASTQIFNSLLPEKGLPFWTIAFCFFWTLWNNLFAEFDT
ncbi:MAG TPA: hypothetical protein VNI60_07160, partial [Pyrinomonadaceae bacterium]|nr:hypothetical protein [Pyrinomonadaceae bacterium]